MRANEEKCCHNIEAKSGKTAFWLNICNVAVQVKYGFMLLHGEVYQENDQKVPIEQTLF